MKSSHAHGVRSRPFSTAAPPSSGSPGKLLIGFTCKVCNTRTHRTMSKQAYQHGIVLIECGGCRNRHVIADNLGWFEQRGATRTIEEMMMARGEPVKSTWTRDEQGAIMECLGEEAEDIIIGPKS